VTIREATLADVPALVAMGADFLHTTSYARLVADNPAQMDRLARQLIASDDGLLLVADAGALVGMIGVLVFPHHLSGERIAGELFWWVDPTVRGALGVRLLRQAEGWAVTRGATALQMVAPDRRVGVLYERLGYAPIETAYQRRLP